MDQGRYELAERELSAAIERGSANPRTHYRYSLLLMRPAGPDSELEELNELARRQLAVEHARRARALDPVEPRYALTEAQALMTAERWADAARILDRLSARPSWKRQAQKEIRELKRRQQQQLSRAAPPDITPPDLAPRAGETVPELVAAVAAIVALTAPKVPEPLPPAPPAAKLVSWPPAGTVLLYGYIAGVSCGEKGNAVTVQTPRYRIQLWEPRNSPATLHSAPRKWRRLPCGTHGYEVNVAYKPDRRRPGFRGQLVAVVF